MKKILYILLISLFINLNVYALNDAAVEGDSNYSSMQSQYNKYNKGESISVSGSEKITVYGMSDCDGTKCSLKYAGVNSNNFKEALSNLVSCSNGEKYFIYQAAGSGKNDYTESNNEKVDGIVYWSEEYQITCTSNNSGNEQTLNSKPSVGNSNNDASNGGGTSNKDEISNNGGNSNNDEVPNNGEYNSSTPGDVSETGVTTYFVILAVIAILSFVSTLLIKKYNLFKNI